MCWGTYFMYFCCSHVYAFLACATRRRVIAVVVIVCVFSKHAHSASPGDYDFEDNISTEIPCQAPERITNGETVVWGDGLLLEYRCKEGHFAVGVTHGACDLSTGTWTIEPPVCVDKGCPELTHPTHGVVNIENSGGLANIVCRQGYFLLGDSTLVCEDGQWKGVFPLCAGTAQRNEKTKSRRMTEQAEVTGLWSDFHSLTESDETCFYHQITPPELAHAIVDTKYVLNEIRHRYVMVATYSCMGGFTLRNGSNSQLFCKNMIWSAPVWPECIQEDNPCETDNGGCHHYCTPTAREAHACSCYDGYSLAGDAKTCVDADECAINNGDCEQECLNTEGSYFCACTVGFVAHGSTCVDVDECAKPDSRCPGPCINLPGNFRCDCDIPGFTGTHSMHHCTDVDECAVENGGCDDLCINKFGSFECRCETKGRKLAEDGWSCVDVDECARYKNKVCTNGDCLNTDGSFVCKCHSGFRLAASLDACRDIDECADNNGGCSQACHNSPGAFRCSCEEGFSIAEDKSTCRDINECVSKRGGCQDVCVNTVGSFRCVCTHVGQVLSEDGFTCKGCTSRQFFNRSTSSCASCPSHAHSRDGLALSVQDCRCDKGFHGNPGLGVQCQDTNECQTGRMNCSHECLNTDGSAHCACPGGFKIDSDGVTCRDINECRAMTHDCSQICDNQEGTFTCRCFSGYRIQGDSRTCTDVDECATGLATCAHQCLNTEGGYSCTCQAGYQLSSNYIDCTDVDECQLQVSPCQHTCTNTMGSYICQCDGPGFKLSRDLSSCLDINECMEGDNPCPDICVNTVGSYSCDCNTPGYHLVANTSVCEDIDECSQTPNPCSHTCVNIPGGFRCVCPAGYDLAPDTNSTVCGKCGYGTYRSEQDSGCRQCPPRSNTTQAGSTSIKDCLCHDGYREDPEGSGLCIDVDECKLGLLKCQQECVNTDGTARCVCRPGFVLHADKTSCTDVNECAVQRGGCAHKCVNTLGSFQCVCNKNYKLAENGLACEDVDGCGNETYGCEYKCVMAKGGPSCVCQPGYELLADGKKCSDVDECKSRKGGCTDTCINTAGSFRCECNIPGYMLFKDGRQCVDINECEVDGACEDVCVNSIGSFKCYCRKQGFALGRDKRHCEDIDECAKPRICQHSCTNLPGAYKCDCDPGHFKHGHNCIPCDKGSYRDLKHPDQRCVLCPPGMTTSREATETVRGCFCLPGYYGNPDLNDTCKDVDECEKKNGGCDQVCNNTDGSFRCSCTLGYAIQADNKTCLPTQCPLLELPKYTKFTTPECEAMSQGRHVRPGATCSVKCKGSFLLLGSESRTCLSNFTWTGSKPNCTGAFTCDRLPLPENGSLEPPLCMLPSVPFRTRCHIRCNSGYKLQGRAASKCRAFNQWSGKLTYKCIKRKYV